ncbi:uncharacterized protein LOC132390945 [Hypanus sabinus]|uniref:uncharacterized protein LOC132390945 n=1 Tax=Hypanus sabinus TaxID=79690 RepID=UPI0028C509EE|nr:uncharacterized protein LOC132390945 [Hypanus sabinus]
MSPLQYNSQILHSANSVHHQLVSPPQTLTFSKLHHSTTQFLPSYSSLADLVRLPFVYCEIEESEGFPDSYKITKKEEGPKQKFGHLAWQHLVTPPLVDTISLAFHLPLEHRDSSKSYIRLLLINYSPAFNTSIPSVLINKLQNLDLPSLKFRARRTLTGMEILVWSPPTLLWHVYSSEGMGKDSRSHDCNKPGLLCAKVGSPEGVC